MSSINDENFLAVALIINRSRDGPAFVFHYPPHVQPPPSPSSAADARDPSAADELQDILFERLSQPADIEVARPEQAEPNLGHNHDEHLVTDGGTRVVPWDRVAGFPAHDLAGMLTPARAYHKKLFQLSLDPLVCVSYPIHVPENGKWKRPKKTRVVEEKQPPPPPVAASTTNTASASASASASTSAAASTSQEVDALSAAVQQQLDLSEDNNNNNNRKGKGKGKEKEKERGKEKDRDAEEDKRSSMTMFNLVFLLNPRRNETRELVESLFNNIVKKVNRAYQYSQQHSDFVWKESKRILQAKDEARDSEKPMNVLWKELLQTSSLAASVHDIYEAVSQNKIATLHLDTVDGVLSPSVQVPMPFFVSDLPANNDFHNDDDDQRRRGLWLTTANAFPSQLEDALDDEPGFLDRNFALLLMDDEKKIIAELQADRDPATLPMVEFVRLAKPTMSFYQVGQSHVLTLGQVRKYAQHFIFWRRAIAIPPLHPRDIYILSPNCSLDRLPLAAQEWSRAFPLAPPLTNFLAELSHCPRPYKTYAPGKAHRPLYLRMLAWLMRGGWVAQLCHFAYVVVWPEILYEVDYEMEAEELAAATAAVASTATSSNTAAVSSSSEDHHQQQQQQQQQPQAPDTTSTATGLDNTADSTSTLTTTTNSTSTSTSTSTATPTAATATATANPSSNSTTSTSAATAAPPPPQQQQHESPPLVPNPSTLSDAEHSAEMARLHRIALRASREAADKATAHARKTPPQKTPNPSLNTAPHLAGLVPHIILDPKKATGTESRYLSAIARRFGDGNGNGNGDGEGEGNKVRAAWLGMSKYFDGRCALERIALLEDTKRKETWGLLLGMREYLICVRHW